MTKILFTLLLSVSAYSQNLITNGDIFPDIDVNKNFIVNPMTLRNLLSVTATTHSLSRNATSPIMGTHDFQITASAAGNVAWTLKPHENFLTGQNCEFKGLYNGGGGTWTAEVFDGTNILNSISLAAVTQVTPFSLTFPCGSGSPTRTVRFRTTASAPQLNVDNLYYGVVTRIGQFSAVSEVQVVNGITIGAVTTPPTKPNTGITADKIEWYRVGKYLRAKYTYRQTVTTGAAAGSGQYLFTLPAGLSFDSNLVTFHTAGTNIDNVGWRVYGNVDWVADGVSHGQAGGIVPYDSTRFRIIISDNNALTNFFGSAGALPLTTANMGWTAEFEVPIQGWSASVSAAAADQTDYGRTAYTPTFTGFGTVTNIDCFHSRTSEFLDVDCRFTSGVSTATEARVSLPNGLIPNIAAIRGVGIVSQSTGAATSKMALAEPSNSYITFSITQSTASLTKQNGSALVNNGEVFHFTARVPIVGWASNQRAPTLIGSVTSNSVGAERIERVLVSDTGVVSNESGDWINGNCTNAAPTVCTFNSGTFSATPVCVASGNTAGNTEGLNVVSTSTTVSVQFNSNVKRIFSLICMGPR